MKLIKTKLHGLLDYTMAFFLMLPFITGFRARGEDTWFLSLMAAIIVVYTLFTDYEYGIFKFIPMKLHLFLDALVAVLLIVLPFYLTVHNYYFLWPIALGCVSLIIVVLSDWRPYTVNHHDLDITKHA